MYLTAPNVEFIDSRDDNRYTYVIVQNCTAPILKTKLNDMCYIMKIVNNECHVQFETTKECQGK